MTNSSTLKTRGMVEWPSASNERWHDARHSRPDHASLPGRARCLAPDADLIRMTQMLAAARRVLFPRCRDRDRNADLSSAAAGCPKPMKRPGGAKRDERPQLTRMKTIQSLSFSVRITIGAQPRAGLARFDRDRRAVRLVGCSAWLAGDVADGSARTPLITIFLFPNAPTISSCPPRAAR